MTKIAGKYFLPFFIIISITGCGPIGEKNASISAVYFVTATLALILLALYCSVIKRKTFWFLLLFVSVFVVNCGYFLLSASGTLTQALWANRLSYFGSVFLPIAMLMIILDICHFPHGKQLPGVLLAIGILVFLVAASPGILDIYYKEVSFEIVNGTAVLHKVYGPWHSLYLVYLLASFSAMVGAIVYAAFIKKIRPVSHAVIIAAAVFVNIGVWLLEQLVQIDFEILSVSYIISELFLISLYLMIQESNSLKKTASVQAAFPSFSDAEASAPSPSAAQEEVLDRFSSGLANLTPAECNIYNFYLERRTTKDIMAELNITENTLKYHNKNLYSKLGVSSRKELMRIAEELNRLDLKL